LIVYQILKMDAKFEDTMSFLFSYIGENNQQVIVEGIKNTRFRFVSL